jgi:hypothetical protein
MLPFEIPFEIHLTPESLTEHSLAAFINFCTEHEAKPMLIELAQGEHTQQPMLSKIVYSAEVERIFELTSGLSNALLERQLPTKRLKIEVPSFHANLFEHYHSASKTYFEWHGKINYDRREELLEICTQQKAHLSRNSLKNEQDKRFITLREHGSKPTFEQRISALAHALVHGGWHLAKQQSEYCIYDSNELLDKGWLPN